MITSCKQQCPPGAAGLILDRKSAFCFRTIHSLSMLYMELTTQITAEAEAILAENEHQSDAEESETTKPQAQSPMMWPAQTTRKRKKKMPRKARPKTRTKPEIWSAFLKKSGSRSLRLPLFFCEIRPLAPRFPLPKGISKAPGFCQSTRGSFAAAAIRFLRQPFFENGWHSPSLPLFSG